MLKSSTFLLLALLIIIILGCSPEANQKTSSITFNIPEDFELEELYTPTDRQGSWVSITEAVEKELFYACDQYGSIYSFKMPSIGERLDSMQVVPVPLNMGYAQGLLWAFNSLYVVVVKSPSKEHPEDPSSGVYRLTDKDGDGILDHQTKILEVDGDGEHGPHTLRVSPDGKSIYLIAGNFNSVPDHFDSRLPRTWREDNLLPPYLDARGHAVDLKAPGGWIARSDPEGKQWELIAAGMRNPFSMGFNQDGELFAYDADMEWDFGMPWYRPTRIVHITSGAEFGWRTGSGKWPATHPDNLPAVVNMAQGSPTAVIMGKDLRFPTQYQTGLFACDWSFGTIYYVDLIPDGSSYTGTKTEFMSGVPLPISNAIAGSDGHMYFMTGGRRLDSHLYRIRYVGSENTAPSVPQQDEKLAKLRQIRQSLEALHHPETSGAISTAWPYLQHPDRHIRYAARIAIEHQPLDQWQNRIPKEKNTTARLEALLAYARSNGRLNQNILSTLHQLSWSTLDRDQKNMYLRIHALLLIRNPQATHQLVQGIGEHLIPYFPSGDRILDRQLSELLVYCKEPTAIAKSVALLQSESLKKGMNTDEILTKELLERSEMYGPQIADMLDNMPPTEAIHYATVLSHATVGWTRDLHKSYFEWFYNALSKKGGMSYKGFLDNIRATALQHIPDDEVAYFSGISGFYAPIKEMADLPKAVGPGKKYNMYDLGDILLWGTEEKIKNYTGTFEDGHRAFQAALCSSCHRMNGEGGASGPDLSNINTRFSLGDISSAILSPSEEVSDQYNFTLFTLKDGSIVTGRILKETEEEIEVFQSPYDMTYKTSIPTNDIVSQEVSPLSPMPSNLLDPLNPQEVRDLLVYLLAGGDGDHAYYTK